MEKYFTPIFLMLIVISLKGSDSVISQITSAITIVVALFKGIPIVIESFSITDFFVVEKEEIKADIDEEAKQQ